MLCEMIRILFSIFSCSCELSCDLESKARARWNGYDLHWQAAAYTIEKASKREDLLRLRENCDRMWRSGEFILKCEEIPEDSILSKGEQDSGFSVGKFREEIDERLGALPSKPRKTRMPRRGRVFKAHVCP